MGACRAPSGLRRRPKDAVGPAHPEEGVGPRDTFRNQAWVRADLLAVHDPGSRARTRTLDDPVHRDLIDAPVGRAAPKLFLTIDLHKSPS